MEVLYPSCCGLDVHKKSVVACAITASGKETRSFGAMTPDLLQLRAWLSESGVSHVAMESTGSYWKPVYNVLEGGFTLLLVNAREIKVVPGRKSDVKDAEWIADLLRHGLLRPSFVPGRAEREMRELSRYRQSLVGERTAEVNRVQKVLEGANIKLGSVASNVMGKSAMAMLEALVEGVEDAAVLADLSAGRLHASLEEIERALIGAIHPHQRFLLQRQLRHIRELNELLGEVEEEVARRQAPFVAAKKNLMSIPGVGPRIAEVILSEIGPAVDRFPTPGHLASWAGLSPGLNESGGKRLSAHTTSGNRSLKVAMVQAAHSAARTQSHLGARYRRLRPRLGSQKTAVAVGRSILVAVHAVLKSDLPFQDLGPAYLDPNPSRTGQRYLDQLKRLGFQVTVLASPAA